MKKRVNDFKTRKTGCKMVRDYIGSAVTGVSLSLASLMAVAVDMQAKNPAAEISDIGGITWLIIVVTGLSAFARDVKSLLKTPPKK